METRFELTSSLRVVDSAHGSVSTKKSEGFMTRSSYSAVLILSVGVTARTLSTAPAVIPASIPRPGERTPRSSARELRIVSYDTNRTAAFAVVPFIFDQYEVRIDEIANTYNNKGRASGILCTVTFLLCNLEDVAQWIRGLHSAIIQQLNTSF